jgi:predicted ATPase
VLDDLQWADTSSLELLHFIARQMTDAPLLLFCTGNPEAPRSGDALRGLRQSLAAAGSGPRAALAPLDEAAVGELLQRVFATDPLMTREFTTLIYRWTRGNPFFLEETLKALIASGDLRMEEGRWHGWQVDILRLPASVRDAVLTRLEVLSAAAREAADTAAVMGARFSFEVLAEALQVTDDALLNVIDELRRARVLEEITDQDDVAYDFAHPLIRETLYADLGRVRVRLLHARVADALEQRYGEQALDHADELAYHFARAHSAHAEEKAARYLNRAGLQALAKHADREAADYLSAALERMRGTGAPPDTLIDTMEALARAQQRLGEYEAATELWVRVQEWAVEHGEPARAAAVARRVGLACYWAGRLGEALAHLDEGLQHASATDAAAVRVRLHTARAACLQELAAGMRRSPPPSWRWPRPRRPLPQGSARQDPTC